MKKKSVVLIASILLVSGIAMGVSYADNSKKPAFDPLSNVQKIKQKDGIEEYKKEVLAKVDKVSQANTNEVLTTITFAKPLNENQVNSLVEEYGLKPRYFMLRLIEPDGKRGTWFTKYLDNGTLKQIMDKNDAKLKGVIELVAELPAENLKALSSDKAVFLVDPSADDYFVNNPKKKYIQGLYWFLENNAMVQE